MSAYYNEHDPAAARWLRELIHERLIPAGDVDERSIRDVSASDLRGYVQCHFFAGIGVWAYALRQAGWEDDRPVGTGSCPCQPFSAAGKGKGFEDPRHLWPDFYRIIRDAHDQGQRWAYCILGEQAPTAGAWIDLVRSDMEALGHAFGSPDIPAAGFGGAHIRQRFYWVADANYTERWTDLAPRNVGDWPNAGRVESPSDLAECGEIGGLGDADGEQQGTIPRLSIWQEPVAVRGGEACWVDDAYGGKRWNGHLQSGGQHGLVTTDGGACDWLLCTDGDARPVEPGTFPLVTEAPARLGRLRGYGNALDGETATNFVAAFMDAAGINSRSERAAA